MQQLFDEIPQSLAFAGQVRYAIRRLATRLVVQRAEFGKAIVVSHTPVAESAVPDPASFRQLAEADIVVYTVEVTSGIARIVNAGYLGCPIR